MPGPKITLRNETGAEQTYEGITIKPGASREFQLKDICKLVRFVNATSEGIRERAEVINAINAVAVKECGEQIKSVVITADEQEPSTKLPQGGDSSAAQGAPDVRPDAVIDVQHGPYGEPGDVRQPAEAMHDPKKPQSEGQIADGELARGASREEAAEAIARGRRGDPPPGEPRAWNTGERTQTPSHGGDPVDLFTGQLVLTAVDLDVPTPFLPIQMQRRYRSGLPFFGPFGFNWDHNWNVFLRELSGGDVARSNGRLHEERFRWTGERFEPPRGIFEQLVRDPGPGVGYTVKAPQGVVMRFVRPEGWTDGERIPLVTITDRAGNTIALAYGDGNRLKSVMDQDGRGLRFFYGSCGILEAVEDHAGRRVAYLHDDRREHLVGVRLPATERYPKGALTRYDYPRGTAHPAMRHNIVRIVDADGKRILENTYGEDPAAVSFNRVVRQLQGGFLYGFSYRQLQWVPEDGVFVNIPAMQTAMGQPDRSLWTYTFNYRGDLLDERFRLNADRSFRVVVTKRSFDAQGNLAEVIAPDGSRTAYTFDAEHEDPRMRGNLLKVELRAPLTKPAPSRIVFRAGYDAQIQLPRWVRAENGAEMRYVYDVDEAPGPGSRGDVVRVEWPDATLPDGTKQSAVTWFETNTRGQITAVVSPEGTRDEFVYLPPGSPRAGFLSVHRADALGVDEQTALDYDAFGFVKSRTEPGGATYGYTHDALGNLTEVRLPAVEGVVDVVRYAYNARSQLARVEYPRGEYSDGVIQEGFLVDTFTTNAFGHLKEVVLGKNTAQPRRTQRVTDFQGRPVKIIDAEGVETKRGYDERGLLLRERGAVGTPDEVMTRNVYDTCGRLVRTYDGAERVTEYAYDSWGRPSQVTLPSGATVHATFSIFNLLEAQEIIGDPGDGSPARVLRRLGFVYDERGRLVRQRLEAFEGDASAAAVVEGVKWYDRDGRCVRREGPRGALWAYGFDGRNRKKGEIDPLGNEKWWSYDVAGLPQRVTTIEKGPGGDRERWIEYEHDARGRVKRATTSAGNTTRVEYDARDLPVVRRDELDGVTRFTYGLLGEVIAQVVDPDGLALTYAHASDALGRARVFTDPMGEVTEVQRDVFGRITRTILADGATYERGFGKGGDLAWLKTPDGSRVEFGYDSAGNLATVTATAGPGRLPVPVHAYKHDALGRMVRAEAGGAVVTRRFDSLDRLVEEDCGGRVFTRAYDEAQGVVEVTFPGGRVERHRLDLLGRVERVERAAAGAPGEVLLQVAFVGQERVARVVHGNGVTTELVHDDEGRVVRVAHLASDGAELGGARYRYDARSLRRLTQRTEPALENNLYRYDARSRFIGYAQGFAIDPLMDRFDQAGQDADVAAVLSVAEDAPLREVYTLDGGDTRASVTSYAQGAVTVVSYTPAPGHKVVAVDGEALTYDGDGRRVNDGERSVTYDVLGRAARIAPTSGGAEGIELSYDPIGRLARRAQGADVEQWSYLGDLCLQDEDGTGAVVAQRTHAMLSGLHAVETRAEGVRYLHLDGHQDLTLVTGGDGAPLERYRYAPFGAPMILDGSGTSTRTTSAIGMEPRFGGMSYLAAAGLYVTPARLYDPATGMFLARDPYLHSASASPYAFGGQDPINRIDPEGELAPLLVAGLVVGTIGAVVGMASVVIRGGDYDGWDVLAAGTIGFGAGFVGGVTFGGVSGAVGGALLTATEGTALAGSGAVSVGISVASGVAGGAASGLASGALAGTAGGLYAGYRGGGNAGAMAWAGAKEEAVSGMAAGAVAGGLFQGLLRVGAIPTGGWRALRGLSTVTSRADVFPSVIARGLTSPYGPLGAGGVGFASGYTGGVVRRVWRGEDGDDVFAGALEEGASGAAVGLATAALHPITWEYWRARTSTSAASQIQRWRVGRTHHQRNVAQYPEFANPKQNTENPLSPLTRLSNAITRGNVSGPWSDYLSTDAPSATHQRSHELWQFGQPGLRWSNYATHGPWTPAWNVTNLSVDPRATNHASKAE